MNKISPLQMMRRIGAQRGALFGSILLGALFAFELFNYSTTDFALTDLLGSSLSFAGLRWATILSVAFCGIDFAGLARLFTPEQGRDESSEAWYLFGAWILAAGMNATLTWWGVAVAINSHTALGAAFVDRATIVKAVPVFVAVMVWLIRILIIGTFAMAGERMFDQAASRPARFTQPSMATSRRVPQYEYPLNRNEPRPVPAAPRPAPKPEPSYHPAALAARGAQDDSSLTRR